ncbi:MAG: hypothetical protein NZT92_13410 [Abditibacteriales bacterium]|nr:hypothetical protein [Abditibacteriales bacterium]MDW8367911.1 hypothetical protein [Abditibacteriales bacterium]
MRHLSERHRSILLFGAPLCAVVMLAFYVLQTARGATSRSKRLVGTPASTMKMATHPSALTPQLAAEDLQIISRRNIFRPLIAPKKVRPSVQRVIQRYIPPTNVKPLPPLIPPMPVQRAPQVKAPAPSQPPASPINGVAVVGTVNVNGVMHGVIEDITRHETRFIRVGEEAFGFRLKQIDDERAVLERDGKTFTLNLGANKEDKPVRPPVKAQPVPTERLESPNHTPSVDELDTRGDKTQTQGGTAHVQPQ